MRCTGRSGRAQRDNLHRIESCRRRGINPYAYLRDDLTRLPNMTNKQIPEVTPEAWTELSHVEPHPESQMKLRDKLREKFNHWTLWRAEEEVPGRLGSLTAQKDSRPQSNVSAGEHNWPTPCANDGRSPP